MRSTLHKPCHENTLHIVNPSCYSAKNIDLSPCPAEVILIFLTTFTCKLFLCCFIYPLRKRLKATVPNTKVKPTDYSWQTSSKPKGGFPLLISGSDSSRLLYAINFKTLSRRKRFCASFTLHSMSKSGF